MQTEVNDELIKNCLASAKTVAMVGVSSVKKEDSTSLVRRPSIIVMSYLQEFGFKVIPVNPFAVGKKINGENVLEKLEDIKDKIDIVNVFRPSKEAEGFANETVQIKAKTLWLQLGIKCEKAKSITSKNNIEYIVADWTNKNDEILKTLETYNRNGVPLYIFWKPGMSESKILPAILTEQVLLDSFNNS